MPTRPLKIKGQASTGEKTPKERITVWLYSNMKDEKLPPLIISKFKFPDVSRMLILPSIIT